ncbi:F-box/LRR-repeat protein 4-like [Tubulanus polymorphus]|uniref:F-box/LRR-repeat protein 4-like n=1 Tax=Tubulanus polymorphus TaxID=672921 RepID=UPI003DA1D61D
MSFLDIPWEDVTYRYVFPFLRWSDLFRLSCACRKFKELVDGYFWTLRKLDLRDHAAKMNPTIFSRITQDNRSIRLLILENSSLWMTDDILVPVLELNCLLHTLDLTLCSNLSYKTIHTLSLRCHRMRKLVLKDCHWITSSHLSKIATNLVELQHLDLSGCWSVTDDAVITVTICCPSISYLSLAKIYGLTDASIAQLGRLLQLRHLSIKGCWRVTNASLRQLGDLCTNLQTLEVTDCSAVTEISLAKLRARGIKMDKPKPDWRGRVR